MSNSLFLVQKILAISIKGIQVKRKRLIRRVLIEGSGTASHEQDYLA